MALAKDICIDTFDYTRNVFERNICLQLDQKKPKLIVSIQFWKIHVGIIQFGRKTKSNMKEKWFQKNTCSQLDPKKNLAQNLNPILGNPFWYNPVLKKGKSNLKKTPAYKQIKCSQFHPKKSEAHSFNQDLENPFANNPIWETGKNHFFIKKNSFEQIHVHSLIQTIP